MFEQLSLEDLFAWNANSTAPKRKNVSLPEPSSDASSHTEQDLQVWVNKYSPGRRVTQYYRLSYNCNGKKKHRHIPGGNVNSQLAIRRAKQLKTMIDRNASIPELLKVIASYQSV